MTLKQNIAGVFCLLLTIISVPIDGTDSRESSAKSESTVSAQFKAQDVGSVFQHLVADEESGNVYVGATNSLYQLDLSELKLRKQWTTGPLRDSPYCSWSGNDCIPPSIVGDATGYAEPRPGDSSLRRELKNNDTRRMMNNFNQVLTVFPKRKLLIVCGTLHQGICSLHKLEDITQTVPVEDPVPVAANSANASTVAFVAPGRNSEDSLFVAATYTYEVYRGDFPAVATRSLRHSDIFNLEDQGDVQGQSSLVIMSEFRSDFRVRYVGGFYSEGFAYWASVQKENPTEHGASYVSKLIRVCSDDTRYISYSELSLECRGPDNSKYDLLRSIRVTKMGKNVINSPGVADEYKNGDDPESTEFLVGVFAKGSEPKKAERSSAVCVFPLKEIRAAFWYNIQRCQNGNGMWNLPHFGFNRQCRNVSFKSGPRSIRCTS